MDKVGVKALEELVELERSAVVKDERLVVGSSSRAERPLVTDRDRVDDTALPSDLSDRVARVKGYAVTKAELSARCG